MKANRIPQKDRLQTRINLLYVREERAWVKFGDGNPYLKCRHCGVSNVQETIDGHHTGCPIKGIYKEIEHYKKLLEQENG